MAHTISICALFCWRVHLRSPGYALSILAESTTGVIHCAEATSQPGIAPEDIALQATRELLAELNRGGCVDRKHQTLVLLFIVLGSEDVGRCRMGEPTPRTFVQFAWKQSSCTLIGDQNTVLERREDILWIFVQNRTCRSWGCRLHATFVLVLWNRLHQCKSDNCLTRQSVL